MECAQYFLDKAREVTSPDHSVTNDEILNARAKTTAISVYPYQLPKDHLQTKDLTLNFVSTEQRPIMRILSCYTHYS